MGRCDIAAGDKSIRWCEALTAVLMGEFLGQQTAAGAGMQDLVTLIWMEGDSARSDSVNLAFEALPVPVAHERMRQDLRINPTGEAHYEPALETVLEAVAAPSPLPPQPSGRLPPCPPAPHPA